MNPKFTERAPRYLRLAKPVPMPGMKLVYRATHDTPERPVFRTIRLADGHLVRAEIVSQTFLRDWIAWAAMDGYTVDFLGSGYDYQNTICDVYCFPFPHCSAYLAMPWSFDED